MTKANEMTQKTTTTTSPSPPPPIVEQHSRHSRQRRLLLLPLRYAAMPNRRRQRGASDDPKVGDAGDDKSKKRSIANILTSLEDPRRELPLLQLNAGLRKESNDHQEDEHEVVSRSTQVDDNGNDGIGAETGTERPSSKRARHAAGAGDVDASASPHQQRRLWVKDRSRAWWDQCSSADYPEADFRRAFRMGRATFDMVCDALGSAVAKEDTALRAAIPVHQRVAVCVWRLATGEPLRLVSKRFGLGISTCHKLVLEVCAAIRSLLMPRFLQWPDQATATVFKGRFEATSGVPGVIGAMYTTHIPIIAPKVSVAAYFNRRHTERNQKTSYSITLQGVVGPDGAFTDVCIGWPGSMPDDQVLDKSALHQRAAAGMMAGSWVVGGGSYPLTDWVLVPYTHQNLTWAQHAFNEKVGELRRVAVDAFARLKGRWACLQKRTEVKLQDLPVVLGACCVLHNICEVRGEEMDPELRCSLVDDETVPENPVQPESAKKARDDIAHNLLHRGLAGTTFF